MDRLSSTGVPASAQTVARDVLEWIESFLSGLTVTDWVLVLLTALGLWWIVGSVRASVRLGPIEVDPLESDEQSVPAKRYSAALRERLARSGLSPPPEVPAGAPQTALIQAVETSPVPQGPWLARLLEVLPTPPKPVSYQLSGTLTSLDDGQCGLKYWLRPARGGEERLATARGPTYDKAIERAASEVYLAITNTAYRVYPPWSRWRDLEAFECHLLGLEARDDLTGEADLEPALRWFRKAISLERRNLLPRLQIANLLERQASYDIGDRAQAESRAEALVCYLEIARREPGLVEARYRASILLSMLTHDWRSLPSARRNALTSTLGFTASNAEERRAEFERRARSESRAVWWRLFGLSVPLTERRLRHRFEPRGHDRRLLKRTVALSRLCIRARRFPESPSGFQRAWRRVLTWLVSSYHLALGGATAGWQAHYNAACFYALLYSKDEQEKTRGRWRKRAFKHLERAIAEPESEQLPCEWLRTGDLDLNSLRDDGDVWNRLVNRHCGPPLPEVRITNRRGEPIRRLLRWRQLASPSADGEWEPGFRLYELARAWLKDPSAARLVRAVLDERLDLKGFWPQRAIAQAETALGENRAELRYHDLLAIGDALAGRTVVSIEATVGEGFGETLGRRLDEDDGVASEVFGMLTEKSVDGPLRALPYRLFSATAAVLAAAADANADQAVLLIHQFDTGLQTRTQRERNSADLTAFLHRLFDASVPQRERWCEGPWNVPGNERVPDHVSLYIARLSTLAGPLEGGSQAHSAGP